MIYAINIDWLELFGSVDASLNTEDIQHSCVFSSKYKFERQQVSGRIYSVKYKVFDGKDNYLYDVYFKPYSKILKENACTIRLSNEECYSRTAIPDLQTFCETIGFTFQNITRLDICHDSNILKNGLTHENLIRGFLSGRFLLQRNLKFDLYGSQKQKFITGCSWHFIKKQKTKNETNKAELADEFELSGAKWGSLKSAVGVKIYNKTLEMKEVKVKQHIINCWKDNALDLTKDIWRIEISLKADSMKWIDINSGELITLHLDSAELDSRLQFFFFQVAKRYFNFKRNNKTENKSRMQDVPLFSEYIIPTLKRYRETHSEKSNKMDKYVVKRLFREVEDFKTYSTEEKHAIEKIAVRIARKYNVDLSSRNLRSTEPESKEELYDKIKRWQVALYDAKRKLYDETDSMFIDEEWNIPRIAFPKLNAQGFTEKRPYSNTDVGFTLGTFEKEYNELYNSQLSLPFYSDGVPPF